MFQVAVFVDAGYLIAQGASLLAGQRQSRDQVRLNPERTLQALEACAASAAPQARILRTYWYDGGARHGRMSSEQDQIALSPRTKVRLGTINSHGKQKGVDSLMVTDLIELSRNRAISDALLIAGDEDIRIAVQMAQTFGVHVHLLGVKPARWSQSADLIREADTHMEWDQDIISQLMEVLPEPCLTGFEEDPVPPLEPPEAPLDPYFAELVQQVISACMAELPAQLLREAAISFQTDQAGVPANIDRPTLAKLRNAAGRDLSPEERRYFRNELKTELTRQIEA